jgi:hypothetical protein
MSEPTQTLQTTPAEPTDEPDTESEFRTLYIDAAEGRDRFASLAKSADDAGKPEIAKVYREVGGTVMTLIMDLASASAVAIVDLENHVADLPDGAGDTSALLKEDADKYLQLFEQYTKLLDGLTSLVPAGVEGDAQREVFATLRRMTQGMADFTKSIVIEDEDDDDDDDDDEDEAPEDA